MPPRALLVEIRKTRFEERGFRKVGPDPVGW